VPTDNIKRPYAYNRKSAEDFLLCTFETFAVGTPNPDMFDVPEKCKSNGVW